ncbi:hypothetical protein MTR67_036708 [Solanum verrucosum]|uniref:Amino acid transporter transmembrane domain-containing protein n=1 Tax=Solanum verrucosum TaxID=315347 RepID=A0AAF0ZMR5_SOLVR|nr:hypothetical protein MTR67_036708 [Solanum verrucosum]
MWDKREWEGEISSVGIYSVTCSFTGICQDFSWHLTCVYAPNDRVEREETWWEIGAAKGLIAGPWVLCGDFNTVSFLNDSFSASFVSCSRLSNKIGSNRGYTKIASMKKASISAIVITTLFYLCCNFFGYAALGNDIPGNLLTGFYEPFWLVDFANVCIVLHLFGGYQGHEYNGGDNEENVDEDVAGKSQNVDLDGDANEQDHAKGY